MTVVSFLKLSDTSGMAAADERSTLYTGASEREVDVYQKIEVINGLMIGISGRTDMAYEVIQRVKSSPEKTLVYGVALEALRESYNSVRRRKFEENVTGKYGVTMDDIVHGRIGNEKLRGDLLSILENEARAFTLSLIFGGYDGDTQRFRITDIRYPGTCVNFDMYSCIGSGLDRADIVISDALQSMTPAERANIDRYVGARILMSATRSAWRNVGVGGSTTLMSSNKNKIEQLGREESNFLNAALFLEGRRILTRNYVGTLFRRIVNDGAKAEDLLSEIAEKVGEQNLRNLFFLRSLHM